MTRRIHTTIAAAVAIAAVAGPNAALAAGNTSHVVPNSSINYTEPGSTGYLPRQKFSIAYTEPGSTGYLPRQKFSISYTEPGSTGWLPTAATTAASASRFDWTSALIGTGAALGIALVCAGGFTALRNRRGLAHV